MRPYLKRFDEAKNDIVQLPSWQIFLAKYFFKGRLKCKKKEKKSVSHKLRTYIAEFCRWLCDLQLRKSMNGKRRKLEVAVAIDNKENS